MSLNSISHSTSPGTITLREYVGQHERDERMAVYQRLSDRLTAQVHRAEQELRARLSVLTRNQVCGDAATVDYRDPAPHTHSLSARVTLPIPGDDLALFIDVEVCEDEHGTFDSFRSSVTGLIACACGRVYTGNIFTVADVRSLYTAAARCGCA